MVLSSAVAAAVGLLLLGVVAIATWSLYRTRRDRALGTLVTVDDGTPSSKPLRSLRWRIVGRPDEVRRDARGAPVPVEWKSRAAPRSGPLPSHRIQVLAYCLLLEESTGIPPPFGVLRYGDGREFRVPWDAGARAELSAAVEGARRPYRGEATPSPAKCTACRFRAACDVRAA